VSSNGYIYHRLSPCEENECGIGEWSISGGIIGGEGSIVWVSRFGTLGGCTGGRSRAGGLVGCIAWCSRFWDVYGILYLYGNSSIKSYEILLHYLFMLMLLGLPIFGCPCHRCPSHLRASVYGACVH